MFRLKKVVMLFFAVVTTLSMGTIALAAEVPAANSNDSINGANSSEIANPAMLKGMTEMELGETRIIGYLDGIPLKITLVSEKNDNMTRGTNKTASKTYNILYADQTAIRINLKASYVVDGTDGTLNYMTNLNGSYTIVNSTFSANWDTSQNTDTETYQGMTLQVYHYTGDAEVRFEAWIKPTITGGVTFYMS